MRVIVIIFVVLVVAGLQAKVRVDVIETSVVVKTPLIVSVTLPLMVAEHVFTIPAEPRADTMFSVLQSQKVTDKSRVNIVIFFMYNFEKLQ